MTDLPTGTVTFLFTDIEGSTGLLQTLGDRYPAVLDEHAAILRKAVADAGREFAFNRDYKLYRTGEFVDLKSDPGQVRP